MMHLSDWLVNLLLSWLVRQVNTTSLLIAFNLLKTSPSKPMIPLAVLRECKNKEVEVHVTDKNTYVGTLSNFDMYVNVSLKDAKFIEFETNKREELGDTLIQGNFITFIRML